MMAKVTRKETVIAPEKITPAITELKYILELSVEEASLLEFLGGNTIPSTVPGELLMHLGRAIRNEGVPYRRSGVLQLNRADYALSHDISFTGV
jgi:hypothetical protein